MTCSNIELCEEIKLIVSVCSIYVNKEIWNRCYTKKCRFITNILFSDIGTTMHMQLPMVLRFWWLEGKHLPSRTMSSTINFPTFNMPWHSKQGYGLWSIDSMVKVSHSSASKYHHAIIIHTVLVPLTPNIWCTFQVTKLWPTLLPSFLFKTKN